MENTLIFLLLQCFVCYDVVIYTDVSWVGNWIREVLVWNLTFHLQRGFWQKCCITLTISVHFLCDLLTEHFCHFLPDVQDFICYLFQCVVVYFQLKHVWILTCELLPLFLWKSFCLGCVPKGGEKPGFVSCERRFANDFNGRKNGPLNYIQWKAVFKNMHFCQWGRLLTALHLVGCCLHSTWNSHGFKFFLLNWDKLASQTRPCECVKKCYDQDCVFSCILLEEHAFPLIALSGIQNTTP